MSSALHNPIDSFTLESSIEVIFVFLYCSTVQEINAIFSFYEAHFLTLGVKIYTHLQLSQNFASTSYGDNWILELNQHEVDEDDISV